MADGPSGPLDDDASLSLGGGRGQLGRAGARAVEIWALAGGAALLGVVLLNVASVAGSALAAMPVRGDFELTEMGVCVAAFAFLPYCQLAGANVTADIFTEGAGPRWRAAFAAAGSGVALAFSLLLLWRMWAGMTDQREYGYTTTILQLPHWMAFVPILISLALLAVAAAMTLGDAARALRAR